MLECFLVLHVCSYCSCVNNYLPGHMQVLINLQNMNITPCTIAEAGFQKSTRYFILETIL